MYITWYMVVISPIFFINFCNGSNVNFVNPLL